MKLKYAIIIILTLIVIGVGIGLKMYFKPHADINNLNAEFKVNASSLMGEFQKEENSATTKYGEKVLEINGTLVAKNKLSNGTDLLVLEDEMQGISCQLDSTWASTNQAVIQSLEISKPITVKGVCKGYLMEIKVSPAVVIGK